MSSVPENNEPKELTQEEALRLFLEPFEPHEVKWKPQSVRDNRALAIAYVDARVVMERLDDVVGLGKWQDSFEILADGSVMCRLKLMIQGDWIEKSDVGSQSEQPDGGDRMKAAFSDALKRAAVKFGIGRYLYRLPSQWTDYDSAKRQFVKVPVLPPWAMPKSNQKQQTAQAPQHQQPQQQTKTQPASSQGNSNGAQQKPAEPNATKPVAEQQINRGDPKTVGEFYDRLAEIDAKLVERKKVAKGELLQDFNKFLETNGPGIMTTTWSDQDIQKCVAWVRKYLGEKNSKR